MVKDILLSDNYLDYIGSYVSPHKRSLIDKIINQRTRCISIVLEDIYKSQNASAVIRTCDCFGIQDIHVVENKYQFDVSDNVTQGASKWVDVFHYNDPDVNNSRLAFDKLKRNGYRIIATIPDKQAISLPDFEVKGKVALVFGSELDGLSSYAIENADKKMFIPMKGFTQSFNLSVSAAIILYDLVNKLYHSGINWQLSDEEKRRLKVRWYKKIIKRSEELERKYLAEQAKI